MLSIKIEREPQSQGVVADENLQGDQEYGEKGKGAICDRSLVFANQNLSARHIVRASICLQKHEVIYLQSDVKLIFRFHQMIAFNHPPVMIFQYIFISICCFLFLRKTNFTLKRSRQFHTRRSIARNHCHGWRFILWRAMEWICEGVEVLLPYCCDQSAVIVLCSMGRYSRTNRLSF